MKLGVRHVQRPIGQANGKLQVEKDTAYGHRGLQPGGVYHGLSEKLCRPHCNWFVITAASFVVIHADRVAEPYKKHSTAISEVVAVPTRSDEDV